MRPSGTVGFESSQRTKGCATSNWRRRVILASIGNLGQGVADKLRREDDSLVASTIKMPRLERLYSILQGLLAGLSLVTASSKCDTLRVLGKDKVREQLDRQENSMRREGCWPHCEGVWYFGKVPCPSLSHGLPSTSGEIIELYT